MYAEFGSSSDCITLTMTIGTGSSEAEWSIRTSQYERTYNNLAPAGCTQFYFGEDGDHQVQTYNFKKGNHLANQKQKICIR